MNPSYRLIFDASQNGSVLIVWMLIPLFAMLFGLLGWGLAKSSDEGFVSKGKIFMAIAACGLIFSIVLLLGNWNQYYQATRALRLGDYETVEGIVQDFVPMPPGGHATESFTVGNVPFHYGAGWGSIVFNSEWNHGNLRNGAHVRIAYKNEDILRIEVQ
jgi:hypothetical protein